MAKRERKSTRPAKKQRKNNSLFAPDRIILGIIIVSTVAIVVGFVLITASKAPPGINTSIPDRSVTFASAGQEHVPDGTQVTTYNSNPPTSGPHYAQPAPTGIYPRGLPDETVVHNLEHGHIWLSYRDATDQEAINMLTTVQQRYPNWVIVTYRPTDDTRVAVAAWTRLLTFDDAHPLNIDEIYNFVARYYNHAPESVMG